MDIKTDKKKPGRRTKRPSADELGKMYETQTAQEIADKLGVSLYTVRSWILKYRREQT